MIGLLQPATTIRSRDCANEGADPNESADATDSAGANESAGENESDRGTPWPDSDDRCYGEERCADQRDQEPDRADPYEPLQVEDGAEERRVLFAGHGRVARQRHAEQTDDEHDRQRDDERFPSRQRAHADQERHGNEAHQCDEVALLEAGRAVRRVRRGLEQHERSERDRQRCERALTGRRLRAQPRYQPGDGSWGQREPSREGDQHRVDRHPVKQAERANVEREERAVVAEQPVDAEHSSAGDRQGEHAERDPVPPGRPDGVSPLEEEHGEQERDGQDHVLDAGERGESGERQERDLRAVRRGGMLLQFLRVHGGKYQLLVRFAQVPKTGLVEQQRPVGRVRQRIAVAEESQLVELFYCGLGDALRT